MNDLDRIAQHFARDGERALADYFVALVPCQLLLLDALTIERRRLPTPTEFVLKAVEAGIGVAEDIAGLLGMTPSYTKRLITGLLEETFLICDELGALQLTVKGASVLALDGERRPIDKTVPLLWDPILNRPIRQRPTLYSQKAAESMGPIWKMPNIFKQPTLVDLSNADSEKFVNIQQEASGSREQPEVIKFLSIKRCLYRYRPATVLVYEKEGAPAIFKVVVDGQIDEVLSTSLAQRDGGKFIGIDSGFSRKAGALAVKERFRQLKLSAGEDDEPVEIANLMRDKSALMFASAILQERIAEEPTEALNNKLADRIRELTVLEQILSKAKVVPLLQFEIGLILDSALSSSDELLVTTTLPTASKLTSLLQKKLESFLQGGGSARIFIAGRPDDAAKKDDDARLLAFLVRLQAEFPKLAVAFLKKGQRPVFEIRSGSRITFSNEPPFGRRSGEFSPRAFRGYQISHPTSVTSYSNAHLTFGRDDLLAQN